MLADLPIRAPAAEPTPPSPRLPNELRWILGGFVAVLAFGVVVGAMIEGGSSFFRPWWFDNLFWLLRDNVALVVIVACSVLVGFVVGRSVGRRRRDH